jgi:hypothetical protein
MALMASRVPVLSLSQVDRLVLGADLNRSESRFSAATSLLYFAPQDSKANDPATAALRDFDPAYVADGSKASQAIGIERRSMSELPQKADIDFEALVGVTKCQ